jgi:archaellum component FlaF (FlaF/FlaG flagellin family)
MVRKDPTQAIVMVLSAFLFLGIVWVAMAQRSVTVPAKPDPLATYGTSGK